LEEPHEELIPEVTTEIMEKRSELINTLGAIRVKHALNHEQFFKKYNTTKEEMKNVISNGSILELDGWINSFKMELE